MKHAFAVSIAILLTGCTGMADSMSRMAGLGVVEEEKSTFDGATIVKVSPAFLYREGAGFGSGVSTKLGAQWNSKTPDLVALVLANSSTSSSSNSYVSFSGLDINIDGVISEYKTT